MEIRVVLRSVFLACTASVLMRAPAFAQGIAGTVRDQTGGVLPGVIVEAHNPAGATKETITDAAGTFRLDLGPGRYDEIFTLVNFAPVRRSIEVAASGAATVDVVLRFVLSADVTVTGKRTFTNLAEAPAPAEDLVGIAQSSSQGAITARQLDARPVMRSGEVFETVTGVLF